MRRRRVGLTGAPYGRYSCLLDRKPPDARSAPFCSCELSAIHILAKWDTEKCARRRQTAAGLFVADSADPASRFRRQQQERHMPGNETPTIWDLMPASLWPTQPFVRPIGSMQMPPPPEGAALNSALPSPVPISLSGAPDTPPVSDWDRAMRRAIGGTDGASGENSGRSFETPMSPTSMKLVGASRPLTFCQLPNGQIVPYTDLGNGFALIDGDENGTDLGAGVAAGNALNGTAMPTVNKPGGLAGGGRSGPVTSPASGILRNLTGRAHYGPLGRIGTTASVGGAAGRMLPGIGTGLMAIDAAELLKAMADAPFCRPMT